LRRVKACGCGRRQKDAPCGAEVGPKRLMKYVKYVKNFKNFKN